MTRRLRSQLCHGTVVHERFGHAANRFRYRMASYLLDVDELEVLPHTLRPLLGVDGAAPVSLRTADHLRTERGATLRARALAALERHGIEVADIDRITLHAGLRVLGYGFNPASLWFCKSTDGELRAVIVEVRNTYGESHQYVLGRDEQRADLLAHGEWRAERHKRFHVSPFLKLDLTYRIRIRPPRPGRPLVFDVGAWRGNALAFRAVQVATPRPLTRRSLLQAQLSHPLMPQRTILLIHWQALRLWLRGARFRAKPAWRPNIGSLEARR